MTTTSKNSMTDIKEIAKCVRADLKAAVASGALSALTFGVKISRYSMGRSLNVTVTAVPAGYTVLNAKREAWSEQNPHATYFDAPADCKERHSEVAALDLKVIERIVGAYNWDRSDSQSDVYNVNFATHIGFDGDLIRAERDVLVAGFKAAAVAARPCERKTPTLSLVAP